MTTRRTAPVTGRVLSVNVGASRPNTAKDTPTGIHKVPVGSITVRPPGPKHGGLGSGVVGDFIGDVRNHGGDDQAVYAVTREQLDWWESELDQQLPDGSFGENLTTTGIDADRARIGERWQVGPEVVLRVTSPRIPCGTFRVHMGVTGWLKKFVTHGLPGAYLAIEVPGSISAGDEITLLERPDHDVTVADVFTAFYGDLPLIREIVAAEVLPEADHQEFVELLARRTSASPA